MPELISQFEIFPRDIGFCNAEMHGKKSGMDKIEEEKELVKGMQRSQYRLEKRFWIS